MPSTLPSHTEYAIIGGGIIGIAYHLTRLAIGKSCCSSETSRHVAQLACGRAGYPASG